MGRRGRILLLAALLLGSLCGCGDGGAQSSAGTVASSAPSASVSASSGEEASQITLAFAGDVNLDDSWCVMEHLREQGGDISTCIDPALIEKMRLSDLCCVNNEFCFSDRGSPMAGKGYTFRSKPENVSIWEDLGVDLVTLANNHVFDYGENAFLDTLDTLRGAGVDYVGAGETLEEAMAPVYYRLGGLTVAVVSATRAEKTVLTPEAGENSPGVLRCYDPERLTQAVAQADRRADVVICCVHWGTEYSYTLEEAQRSTARTCIDAGADVIVGTHSHCLQGIEYYRGAPVFYSLGNFWFNEKELETCLLELTLTGTRESWSLSAAVVPALQSGYETRLLADGGRVYGLLNDISVNAGVRGDGTVYQRESE